MINSALGRSTLAVVSALSVVIALAAPSFAHVQTVWDGNDSPSKLDIKWAGLAHDGPIWYGAIVMMRATRAAELDTQGDMFIDVDSRGNHKSDYYIWIDHKSGDKLKGGVYKYTRNGSYKVARAAAWREGSKWFWFAFHKKAVKQRGGFIRWYASARYFKSRDYYGNITYRWDSTPDRGMKSHKA